MVEYMGEQGNRMLLTRWTVIVTFSWDSVIAWLEVCYMICPILVGKARPIYGALAIGGYVIAIATPSCLTIADLFNSVFQALHRDSFQEIIIERITGASLCTAQYLYSAVYYTVLEVGGQGDAGVRLPGLALRADLSPVSITRQSPAGGYGCHNWQVGAIPH